MLIRGLISLCRRLIGKRKTIASAPISYHQVNAFRANNQRRLESLSGIFYLRRSLRIWQLVLWSFIADLLFFAVLSELKPTSLGAFPLAGTLITAVLVAAIATMRGSVVHFSDALRAAQFKLAKSKAILPLLIAVTIIPLAELIIKLNDLGTSSMIALVVITVGAIFSISRQTRQRRQQDDAFERDAVSRIEELNKQNFVICLVPIACARLVGLVGVLNASISDSPFLMFVLYEVLALVLFANLRPITDQFLTRCNRCACWASRPFKHYHCCPSCSADFHGDKAKALRERLSTPGSITKEEIRPIDAQIRKPVVRNPDQGAGQYASQCQAKKPRRFFELAVSRATSSRRSSAPSPIRASAELRKPLRGKG